MKKWLCLVLFLTTLTYSITALLPSRVRVSAAEDDLQLHAKYAVLLDGDSGRVLYGKNEDTPAPMASTTKIMSCVIALEYGLKEMTCTTSAYAASMPDVQLNAKKGETFTLNDLLYSLMLKSHNDSAVIIAENVACYYIYQVQSGIYPDTYDVLSGKDLSFVSFPSGFDTSFLQNITTEQSKTLVAVFTGLMNEKAVTLGCTQTHFITPNGLDASDETGEHATTARELAVIMSYCIQNEEFLAITQAKEHQFDSYSVSNANAFLNMYDGVLSGKTGFTGNAGYCYVCACRYDGKTFIAALLACGWPNNKNYKWTDTRKLMEYGMAHYRYDEVWKIPELSKIPVENGVSQNGLFGKAAVEVEIKGKESPGKILVGDDDVAEEKTEVPEKLDAPVKSGTPVGQITYLLNGEKWGSCQAVVKETVRRRTFTWIAMKMCEMFYQFNF